MQIYLYYSYNTMLSLSYLMPNFWFGDAAVAYQPGFQDPATTTMEGIYLVNLHLLFVIISIVFVVGWLLFSVLTNFTEFDNSDVAAFVHSNPVEIIWTTISALILLSLASPLFFLLYSLDEISNLELSLEIFPINKTMCMGIEYKDFRELVDALSKDELTKPRVDQWDLPDKIEEFNEIVHDLCWQFYKSREFLRLNELDSEAIKLIREQLVPEKWEQKLSRLEIVRLEIVRAYFSINLLSDLNPSYLPAMKRHTDLLKQIENEMNQSREEMKVLEEAMIKLRTVAKDVLKDNSIPDNIIVNMPDLLNNNIDDMSNIDNLVRSMEDSVSTLTQKF